MLTESVPYFLDAKEPQLYHWQPRQQNNRILAQQSIFFFGDYEFEEDAACIIEKCKKEDIRTELERISGITEIRLFPDFEGFASLRDDQASYTPLSADEHAKRAEQSFKRHKFEEAIADYDKAIYREPTKASFYYSRGLVKAQQEQHENAIDDYNDAIRLNSSYASAYYERGLVKARLGQYEPAIADYDKAIGLNSNDALFYNARGFAKEQLGQYEEAREDRQKSVELAQLRLGGSLGEVYTSSHNNKEARKMINLFGAKGKNNAWCSLDQVDFSHSYYDNFKGFIYIIWYWNKFGEPVTIKVGQGNIRERLEAHNTDPQIQAYAASEFARHVDEVYHQTYLMV